MPSVVPVYRTYARPKVDNEGKAVLDKDGKPVMETVIEEHSRYAIDAKEAVRNGKGEWSMFPPKDKEQRFTHVPSDFDVVANQPKKKRKTIDD